MSICRGLCLYVRSSQRIQQTVEIVHVKFVGRCCVFGKQVRSSRFFLWFGILGVLFILRRRRIALAGISRIAQRGKQRIQIVESDFLISVLIRQRL